MVPPRPLPAEAIFGTIGTHYEVVCLEEIHEASGQSEPTLTARNCTALRAVFGKRASPMQAVSP